MIDNLNSLLFWLGTAAGSLTTISFIPQVIKASRSKHTKDLSFVMLFLFSLGLVFWIAYGFLIYAKPVIIANVVTLGLTLYLIFLKMRYG